MEQRTISFCKGKGSLAHNNREFITDNVDKSRSHLNIVYTRESLEEAYEKLFREAVRSYNEKQKRVDRKIQNYLEHVTRLNNGVRPYYEIIVQIGNKYNCSTLADDGEKAAKILTEYMHGFTARNPNLYVFNAVCHMDEIKGTPHVHIDFIPFAVGYANGLSVRNALDKALAQQGIDGKNVKRGNRTQKWEEQEKSEIEKIMKMYQWERKPETGMHRDHMSLNAYKTVVQDIDNRKSIMPDKLEKKPYFLGKDKVVVAKEVIDKWEERDKLTQIKEENLEKMEEKLNEAIKMQTKHNRDLEVKRQKYEELYILQKGLNREVEDKTKQIQKYRTEIKQLQNENEELLETLAKWKKDIEQYVKESEQEKYLMHERVKKVQQHLGRGILEMCEAVASLQCDHENGYAAQLTDKQDKLLDAIINYGAKILEVEGLEEWSSESQEYYCVSEEIEKEMVDLTNVRDDDEWER